MSATSHGRANTVEREQRHLQPYYTESDEIVSYMVALLSPRTAERIWEPCAGSGDLVAGVLAKAPGANIVASEIDPRAFEQLQTRYSGNARVMLRLQDAVLPEMAELWRNEEEGFDKIIANPPYGAWQGYTRRRELRHAYPGIYVRETYGVFMFRCFQALRHMGRMVFIVPDTFLWLNRHERLRRHLFAQGTINEIALFPSAFFPGVRFGYSGMCIISIDKRQCDESHSIRVISQVPSPSAFLQLAAGAHNSGCVSISGVRQAEVRKSPHCHFPVASGMPPALRNEQNLGEVADIVTGFYSGNDRKWLRTASPDVRGAQRYTRADEHLIYDGVPSTDGLEGARCFVPIVKGGAAMFVKRTLFYVDWSRSAVREYRRAGRNPARFQNSRFYFREGIGVPMVASARLTAALLEGRLFDQGIVGVFPKRAELHNYILGYLNTALATECLRAINPTANNSAEYLKRLPFVEPSPVALSSIENLVDRATKQARESGMVEKALLAELDQAYREVFLAPVP